MKKYWYGGHTKHRNMFHLVWLPKYRKKILQGRVKERLDEYFRESMLMNGCEIQELNIQLDHVHMVAQIPPSISVSKVVQYLKGGSSKLIRLEAPEVKKYLWGDSFWADGFFSETVGFCSEETILNYVRNQ